MAPEKEATFFCDSTEVLVMGAAFVNSCLFHERAQEDTLGTTHAGVIVIPVALAVAEINGNPGKEVLEAIIFDRRFSLILNNIGGLAGF